MKNILIISLFFISFSPLFCQLTAPNENIEILDSISNNSAKTLCAFIKERNLSGSNIHFLEGGYKSIFKIAFLQMAKTNNITFASFDKTSQNPNTIELAVKDFSVTYSNYPDDPDTVIRTAKIEVTGTYTDQNLKQEVLSENKFIEKDKIHRTFAENQSKKLGDYGNGTLPEPPKSFWKEVTEPAIIISAAVVTVLLLFTVRSN